MKHELPALPYSLDALEPVISAETLQFHHGKHHRGYVDKVNELIQGTEYIDMPLIEILLKADGPLFNNAAQAWNHSFYWQSMQSKQSLPRAGSPLSRAIDKDFGSIEKLRGELKRIAAGQFGSGWGWLVKDDSNGRLSVMATSNAENPLRKRLIPILTVDVWEHAYYIDYRNDRAKYLDGVMGLLNWEFAERCFSESTLSRTIAA